MSTTATRKRNKDIRARFPGAAETLAACELFHKIHGRQIPGTEPHKISGLALDYFNDIADAMRAASAQDAITRNTAEP